MIMDVNSNENLRDLNRLINDRTLSPRQRNIIRETIRYVVQLQSVVTSYEKDCGEVNQ